MARQKQINRTQVCETWNYPLYLFFVPDEYSWKQAMKHMGESFPEHRDLIVAESFPQSAGHTLTLQPEGSSPYIFVSLNVQDENDPVEIASMLCHEAVHVYQWLLQTIKEKPPAGPEEPGAEWEAYTIHQIFQELLEAFRRSQNG